ncbi:ABC transporter ATP-binding protein [Devosia nitrariae]|uniref:ABC transporter ATP-binding protein n=1 Tax=Devosia nitrariae TaxID=2071872 RepID=A0ABQ5W6Y6_9HYPH|nr:ABC transporter ATP-binding protein [Devosia nitrariae]GLQ55813.1 ABC transporter ATP-binding protein [Devosia nitrariae]
MPEHRAVSGSAAAVPALSISGLSVALGPGSDATRIIHDVNLEVARGECVGVVGESGCGKTVSFLATLGLLPSVLRVSGSAKLAGEEILGIGEKRLEKVRGRKVGMIFQDPQSALNPVRTIGAQVMEPLRRHLGMSARHAEERALELLSLVGIPAARDRLKAYPHEISGGTCQRVMIAVALASEPEVLIADEPTTALDATVQLQVLDLLRSIQEKTSLSIVFITHDLGVVAEICNRVVVMYAGRTIEAQNIPKVFEEPDHPYTRALLDCLPALDIDGAPPRAISGDVPMPGRAPPGCPFHPRCPRASDICREKVPVMQSMGAGQQGVACHHPLQGHA